MKSKIIILLALLFLCGASIFAQTESESVEAVIIELKIKNGEDYLSQNIDVQLKTDADKMSGGFGGGMACSHCDNSKLLSYSGSYKFKSLNPESSKIKIRINTKSGKRKCSVKKNLKIISGKPETLELKCGVKLKAYYGFILKEEN